MKPNIDITTDDWKALKHLLSQHLPGVEIWAFGSRVKWSARPDSDLDLVVFATASQQPQVHELKDALDESSLPFRVDLLVWEQISEAFRDNIRRQYVVLMPAKRAKTADQMGFAAPLSRFSPKRVTQQVSDDMANGDAPTHEDVGLRYANSTCGAGFQKTTLSKLVNFSNGRSSPERFDNGKFPVFGSNGLIGKSNETNAPSKSIVVGRVGSYCGSVHFSQHPCWVTDNAIKAIAKDENSPEFLFYLLKHLDLNNWRSGSGQPLINQTTLNAIEVFAPEPEEQKEIGQFVGALDDRIALLRDTNATLEAIAQALFKSWFVDFDPVRAKLEGRAPEGMDEAMAALFPDSFEDSELGLVPRGWQVRRLGDATERITKGTTPTTLRRPFVEKGINFIKAESMTGDGGFIPEKFAFIDEETHELLRRSQLQDGDVLISIAGTIGRIAVMSKDFLPANTDQAVALIRPLARIFPSGLINRFLRLSESQQRMGEKVIQAVQANLSLGTLSDLKVVVPPESVVCELYQSGLAQIDASWTANDQRVRTLATLRDTLLPRLISGQLRLPAAISEMEDALA